MQSLLTFAADCLLPCPTVFHFFCFSGREIQIHLNPQSASSSSSIQSLHLIDFLLSYYPERSNLEKKIWCALSSRSVFIQCCSTEPDLDNPVKDHITPYSNIFIINLHCPYLWLKDFNFRTQILPALKAMPEVQKCPRLLHSSVATASTGRNWPIHTTGKNSFAPELMEQKRTCLVSVRATSVTGPATAQWWRHIWKFSS